MVTKATDAVFLALQEKYGTKIAQAFLEAINDLRAGADLQRLIKAISDGDIAEAEAALNLDAASLNRLKAAITETFDGGGVQAVSTMPAIKAASGAKVVIRFDIGNPRAEQWLKDNSSSLVRDIMTDQRTSIQEALRAGMQAGDNPRTTALDIVGRVSRATGKREGGIIGLSGPQTNYLEAAKQELASTDPKLLRKYLSKSLRDRRFDRAVLKAIESGDAISVDTQAAAVVNYANKLLKLRGDTIARTESLTALHAATHEAYQQAIDKGVISAQNVRKIWHSAEDARVRFSHAVLDGESIGMNETFTSPLGNRMRYPGDMSLGAGPEDIVNCRCVASYRIDFLANLK